MTRPQPTLPQAVSPNTTGPGLAVKPRPHADAGVTTQSTTDALDDYIIEELLVEEISIDGMCGVY